VTVTLDVGLLSAGLPSVGPVQLPNYDRSMVTTGIVHFGVGGFHRAHQAMVIDELMNEGKALDWGICGVGVLPVDVRMKQVMDRQDCLYTLVEKHPDGSRSARVIGSIVEYLFAPDDPEAVIEKLASRETRIVSLTVTEGGYNFDQQTGEFDASNPAVLADLAENAAPSTVFGLVVEALIRRKGRGIPAFTIMSCDNIQGNGDVARKMFTAFAALRDPAVADWITRSVAFPNSMVDRITPVTTTDDIAEIETRFGIQDQWPVVCEPFFQWVVEENFPLGRPPLEDAGVQVVDDVEPYELMKLRLLNASHQGMCYFGYLSGYRYAHEAAADPAIAAFLPVIREQLATGGEIERSAAIVASWARYAEGVDELGEPIEVVDRLKDTLVPLAQSQHQHPLAFISNESLFGSLAREPRFIAAYEHALLSLFTHGAHATVAGLSRL